MSTIISIFSHIGSFLSSILDTIGYITDFAYSLIVDFADLLSVTPLAFKTIVTTFAITSVVIACKRALL